MNFDVITQDTIWDAQNPPPEAAIIEDCMVGGILPRILVVKGSGSITPNSRTEAASIIVLENGDSKKLTAKPGSIVLALNGSILPKAIPSNSFIFAKEGFGNWPTEMPYYNFLGYWTEEDLSTHIAKIADFYFKGWPVIDEGFREEDVDIIKARSEPILTLVRILYREYGIETELPLTETQCEQLKLKNKKEHPDMRIISDATPPRGLGL